MAPDTPPSFSLPPPAALRKQALVVSARAARTGRPRARYLASRRSAIASVLSPVAAMFACGTLAVATLDAALASFPPSRSALVAQVLVALVLATSAAGAFVLRRRHDALLGLAIGCGAVAALGWAFVAHATGGPASPFAMLPLLACVAFALVVPLPPRAALVPSACALFAVPIVSTDSPAYAWLIAALVAVGTWSVARFRHRANLAAFLRTERAVAAVARMRRVQEQLVVVEKLEALRVLVGGMAHELNNALAISQASNQQAARDLETNAALAKAAIGRSDGGLQRIKRTVDRLRRFAMAAEGVLEPADVSAMLDFALESAIGRARSGVVVERTYDADVGAVEVHVSALAEALFQIARNAIEAMPGGGTIEARVRREGDMVVLSVADQGRGIPEDQLAHVFDPFFSRAPGKTAQKSGLGLSAVYGLVTALGGHVELTSQIGKGTEVSIALPARKVQPRS